MSQVPSDESEPAPPKTVMETVAALTGTSRKVLLPDEGSVHGASPVITPGAGDVELAPGGRGNYQVMGEIARGGMGVILKGHDTDLGRDVAFKVLDAELSKNPAVVQRFVEEAQIGGQLQHPGIVPVYELGLMADERPYFTMKLIKGRTLSAIMQQRKQATDDRGRLLSIFSSVCQTVAYAHSKGVLHRDLKPANIMVGAFGEVMVVDWGLAKVLNRGGVADEERARHDRSMLTVIETVRSGPGSSGSESLVGSVMGTPAYMSPEQAQGEIEKLDARADVFSLGAILCEILTGRPPYVKTDDGESLVVQAARARLDPARASIEACVADEALKRLCLECLMPAAAARPTDASEVARIIAEHEAGVEERAHQAELEAATARIKAHEERRARVLTLALGSVVLAATALGGGGYYVMDQRREARDAQTLSAVEEAQGESVEFALAGRPDEALEAARRAVELAETGGASEALFSRARHFEDEARADLDAALEERALLAQDEALRTTLEQLRFDQAVELGTGMIYKAHEAAFAQAFEDYGVDLDAEDIVPALERFHRRDIAEEVALHLDSWGFLRRQVHGARSEEAENVVFLAMDLDPDPQRMALRQAILDHDQAALVELARTENLHLLPPSSIRLLARVLWNEFTDLESSTYPMYDRALVLYPDDFVLQVVGGVVYSGRGLYTEAVACWQVARSMRPHDARVRGRLAKALLFAGRLLEAVEEFGRSLELAPEDARSHYERGMTLQMLGDYEEALAHLERAFELGPEGNWESDLAGLQFYLGLLDAEQMVARLNSTGRLDEQVTYAFALVDHPDSAMRRPDLVLQFLEELGRQSGTDNVLWQVEALARVEVSDFEGAQAALAGRYRSPDIIFVSPCAIEFLRARVYAGLRNPVAARECHTRAMVQWESLSKGGPTGWENSDVLRWRREADAALGL